MQSKKAARLVTFYGYFDLHFAKEAAYTFFYQIHCVAYYWLSYSGKF